LSGADLEASIGGGDVERGEAVVEGGAAGEGAVGGEVGGQGVEVPELRGAEEVVLVAGAGTAHPVTHVRGPSSGLWRRGRLRRRLLPPPAKWGRWAPAGDTGVGMGKERRTVFTPFYLWSFLSPPRDCLFFLSFL
jgi:hypothetical protein